jgi:hypothetical protein
MEVWLHVFLTSAVDGDEWSVPHFGPFSPRERSRYPLKKKVKEGDYMEELDVDDRLLCLGCNRL